MENNGECGVCGDPAGGPYANERGGIYDRGQIGRYYEEGQTINVTIDITAAEGGAYRFSLCDRSTDLTQSCFDRYPLKRKSDGAVWIPAPQKETIFTEQFVLPPGVTCTHCVLQWKHTLGTHHPLK